MRKATQLTIRFDPEVEQRIRAIARAEHLSLNQAALKLVRAGAGLATEPSARVVGSSFDKLIGTWSEGDAREMESALAWTERVDTEEWATPKPARTKRRRR